MTIAGVNGVKKRKADGSVEYRYYAWRGKGAPCFWSSPHKPVKQPFPRAFVDAYTQAMKDRNEVRDDFSGLSQRYLASPGFASLARTTQGLYRPLIDDACERFGTAPLHVISDPRFRAEIIAYRDGLSGTPRKADHAVQAVSVVLEHGRNLGLLATNPANGVPSLYRAPGDKRPWTEAEIIRFTADCPRYILDAFDLMRHFALRRTDAAEIHWSADKGTHLAFRTSKSGRRREAVIPVLPAGRAFLDDLRRRNTASLHILVAGRGTPWGEPSSITKAFAKRWKALGETGFPSPHRLRNNAATAYLMAGLDERTIADAMGWSLADVEDMRRVYVDREAVVSAAVIRMRDRNGTEREAANRLQTAPASKP